MDDVSAQAVVVVGGVVVVVTCGVVGVVGVPGVVLEQRPQVFAQRLIKNVLEHWPGFAHFAQSASLSIQTVVVVAGAVVVGPQYPQVLGQDSFMYWLEQYCVKL